MYTPINPTLYRKTGVCRGIPIFLIFAPKHRLCVLVRTASPSEEFQFLKLKNLFIAWARFRNVFHRHVILMVVYLVVLLEGPGQEMMEEAW